MPHWKTFFNSPYLRAADLDGDVTLTIDYVRAEEVVGEGGRTDTLPVAHFKESGHKPLVLNRTNSKTIEKIHKISDTDKWSGLRVTLYQDETTLKKELVDCIRIRPKRPQDPKPTQKQALTPDHVFWKRAIGGLVSGSATLDKIKSTMTLSAEHEALLLSQAAAGQEVDSDQAE